MDTKILKCFQIVCEEKSLSRAAKRLYITPQGLSKNIRQLEQRRERLRIGCANGVLNLLPLSLILAFGVEHTGLRLGRGRGGVPENYRMPALSDGLRGASPF